MAGAKIGNKNATKGKDWTDAIRHALATYENDSIKRGHALKAIALKLVGKCLEGDTGAMEKLGDRIEGKVPQAITGADGGAIEIAQIQRVVVDEKKPE
jgi:hypothetical protein